MIVAKFSGVGQKLTTAPNLQVCDATGDEQKSKSIIPKIDSESPLRLVS
jgi:hypothetical protein